jgi:pseudouridine kinase
MAKSTKKLVEKDSNIGKLSVSFGGVGRNIVENLARIGNKVIFFTGIGNDTLGRSLQEELEGLGVEVYTPKVQEVSSSYLSIHDFDGTMKYAICDSRASDKITIDFINENNSDIRRTNYICLETNISPNTIRDLFRCYPDKKWVVEAVSANKVVRVSEYLDRIYLFKGNRYEAKAVIDSDTIDIRTNIKEILNRGTQNVIISAGSKAVYYGNKNGIFKIAIEPFNDVVNDTGAGDAMFAGIIDQINTGKSLEEAIKFGNKLALESLKTTKAVSLEIEKYRYNHE